MGQSRECGFHQQIKYIYHTKEIVFLHPYRLGDLF